MKIHGMYCVGWYDHKDSQYDPLLYFFVHPIMVNFLTNEISWGVSEVSNLFIILYIFIWIGIHVLNLGLKNLFLVRCDFSLSEVSGWPHELLISSSSSFISHDLYKLFHQYFIQNNGFNGRGRTIGCQAFLTGSDIGGPAVLIVFLSPVRLYDEDDGEYPCGVPMPDHG